MIVRRIHIQNQNGFSFIELILTMALIGVMSLFLAGIFRNSIDLFSSQDLEIRVVEAANILNKFLLDNLRIAEGVEDTITDDGNVFVSDEDQLIIRLPALDGSGDPIVGVYDHVVFYKDFLNPGHLRWRTIPDGSSSRTYFDRLAAEEITDLVFEYDTFFPEEANLVTVTFTLSKDNYNGSRSISRSTSINMRNQ